MRAAPGFFDASLGTALQAVVAILAFGSIAWYLAHVVDLTTTSGDTQALHPAQWMLSVMDIWQGSPDAARERLDTLTWVVNCNLQRLDGPVRAGVAVVDQPRSASGGDPTIRTPRGDWRLQPSGESGFGATQFSGPATMLTMVVPVLAAEGRSSSNGLLGPNSQTCGVQRALLSDRTLFIS